MLALNKLEENEIGNSRYQISMFAPNKLEVMRLAIAVHDRYAGRKWDLKKLRLAIAVHDVCSK